MELNDKEQRKYETIEKLVNCEISRKEAIEILKLSSKQITRLVNIFKEKGKNGFIHKNRGKTSPKKKISFVIEEIKVCI